MPARDPNQARAERALGDAPAREELHDRVERSLRNHPPASDAASVGMESLRAEARTLGHALVNLCPLGREQSLALTHLEETLMWAIKAITLDQSEYY